MYQSVLSYINYFIKAKSKYGIHSPFVYDFVTKGLETRLPQEYIDVLKKYRKDLSKDTTVIKVTDFGAGSKVFSSNKRAVNKIAKYAGIGKTKAILLQKIIRYFKPINILEIGTSLGIGTVAISSVAKNAKITSLEGCPETALTASKYLKQHIPNTKINIEVGEFSKTLPLVIKNTSFDLVYFDGNHRKKPTIDYFELALMSTHNDSLFIFDDIHWSKEMEEAWEYIKQHKKVSVTIDLYHIGIVFFRKEQVKQDFIIKR